MTEIRHSLDWLQYATEWPNGVDQWPIKDEEALPLLRTVTPHLHVAGLPPAGARDSVAPMQGYARHYDLLYASAHIDPNRREQKITVRMTGGQLGAYRDLGGSDKRLVEYVYNLRARSSRVDIAFDLFDFGIDILRLYDHWKSGKLKTRAHTVQPIVKGQKADDGTVKEAVTLYIGSRQSETMVRIYDKAAQMNLDGTDWTRVELELKGDKAVAVMESAYLVGYEQVAKQVLRDYIQAPYKFWKQLTQGDSVELTPVGRKMTDHEAWVHNIIIPMLRDDIYEEWFGEGSGEYTRAVESLLRDNWMARAQYHRERLAYVPIRGTKPR